MSRAGLQFFTQRNFSWKVPYMEQGGQRTGTLLECTFALDVYHDRCKVLFQLRVIAILQFHPHILVPQSSLFCGI